MNSLSWFLYFADVSQKLLSAAGAVVFFGLVFAIFVTIFYLSEKKALKLAITLWSVTIFASLITIVVPSKDTLYAIAASQLGEKVIESTIGQKTKQALELWIDNQINELNNKKGKRIQQN